MIRNDVWLVSFHRRDSVIRIASRWIPTTLALAMYKSRIATGVDEEVRQGWTVYM